MIYSNCTVINALKSDDHQKAFAWIYDKYFPALCAYAVTIVKCREIARGVVQNLFLKLWEKREQIDISLCLKAYLYNGVRNGCLNYINEVNVKRKHYDCLSDEIGYGIDDDNPESIWMTKEKRIMIEKIADHLPKQCKMVFKMRYKKGLTYEEIASELGISIGTVKVQINRAKNKLPKLLEKIGFGNSI